jgi:outer membrane receptor protein involved in Fe transport
MLNRGLWVSSTALALSCASTAYAQRADSGLLEEITVTATRQTDTVNRVPLTITAITQALADQQGVKTAADLTRVVPGLNVVSNGGGAQQTFSIRGIVGTTGAATTSVYLDDTNLTKRANGGVSQNNGAILPLLYDLERVEVLKGPQGTLFGGSSEGGTVRYITPTPSLTTYSGAARAEVSSMGGRGDLSKEVAGAFGGPLVEDKLALRVSGIKRKTGGWIDVYSAYNGKKIADDANATDEWAVRGALLWKLADGFKAQASYYHVDNSATGGPGSTTALFVNRQPAAAGTTFTTTQRCITSNTRTAASAVAGGRPAASFVPPNVACATPSGVYTRPGNTYGPFVTGSDISLATGRQTIVGSGSKSTVAALTLEADLGWATFKSATSYLSDSGNSDTVGGEEWNSATVNAGQFTTADPTHRGFPLFQPFYDATGGRGHTGSFFAINERDGVEQEFRLSSASTGRLTWVAGMFYSDTKTHILYRYLTDPQMGDQIMKLMYGPTFSSAARYGLVNDQGFQARLEADIKDKELAGFAEANFWIIPDRLKAIAGLRYSKVDLDYYQTNYGQFSGRLISSLGSVTAGQGTDKPVTPKAGLQYQFNANNMAYATASKGFRAGGVNAQISQTICEAFLTPLGLTASDVPPAFGPDSVWSYELGGKFRLTDTLQVNVAVFRIDWKEIQATTTLGCGQGFTANGGAARSEGAEIQVQYRPLRDLSFYVNAGYTDAHYVDPVVGISGPGATSVPAPSFNAGDKFNIPPLQASFGTQFDFRLGSQRDAFVRLDGSYQNEYRSGATFGASGYGGNYFTRFTPSQFLMNLRVGTKFENGLDANFYVANLLDNEKQIGGFSDGRGACSATSVDCSVYTSYSPFVAQSFLTPRRFGLQLNYKF